MAKNLFDDGGPTPPGRLTPTDPNVAAAAAPRLSRQCAAILERLRRGRTTNASLCGLALNYRARVSDLRKHGYDVRCVQQDQVTGLAWYALFQGGREVSGR